MRARLLSAALSVVTVLSATAAAHSDMQLADAVHDSIRSYPRFTVFDDVSARVEGSTVTLFGKVTIADKKAEIERRVIDVPGVREVRNRIAVLPQSRSDDQLRSKVARAIYGHPAFWRYAALPRPPIHIVVEHGRVTLTGRVPNEVDRALAQSLATGHGEVDLTNALVVGGAQGATP